MQGYWITSHLILEEERLCFTPFYSVYLQLYVIVCFQKCASCTCLFTIIHIYSCLHTAIDYLLLLHYKYWLLPIIYLQLLITYSLLIDNYAYLELLTTCSCLLTIYWLLTLPHLQLLITYSSSHPTIDYLLLLNHNYWLLTLAYIQHYIFSINDGGNVYIFSKLMVLLNSA
jgi:hypothetical protein